MGTEDNIDIFFCAVNVQRRILSKTLCHFISYIALGFARSYSLGLLCHQSNQRLVQFLIVFLERMLSVTVCFPCVIRKRVAK